MNIPVFILFFFFFHCRINVQDQKNTVSKDIEDMKVENQSFLTEMNSKIQDGKVKHIELTNEV